jgi:hypothetical protein
VDLGDSDVLCSSSSSSLSLSAQGSREKKATEETETYIEMSFILEDDQIPHDLFDRHFRVYTGHFVNVDLFLRAKCLVDPGHVFS